MVKMYPEELPNRVRNELGRSAEITLYDALHDQLGENWVVFYSVAWLGRRRTDGTPRDGETDFIVAPPEHGVLLLNPVICIIS